MTEKTYFDERKIYTIKKLRKIRDKLPYICNEFFIGIESQTTELTRLGYAQDLMIFFDFLISNIYEFSNIKCKYLDFKTLEKITTTNIEMFLEYLTYYNYNNKQLSNSKRTKARKLSSIKSFFKYNYNKGNLAYDVASKISAPKINDMPIVRLEPNEVSNLLDTIENGVNFESNRMQAFSRRTKKRDIAILTLFLGTGIRISELVGLNITDLDFSINAFKITRKGGNQSILYFSDEVATALFEYLDERSQNEKLDYVPALFASLQSRRIGVRAVENMVKKYSSAITPLKNITPHKLRSTYGTCLYQETRDIYIVAEVLGHKDINTTKKHYAAISDDIKRKASKKVILRKDN